MVEHMAPQMDQQAACIALITGCICQDSKASGLRSFNALDAVCTQQHVQTVLRMALQVRTWLDILDVVVVLTDHSMLTGARHVHI